VGRYRVDLTTEAEEEARDAFQWYLRRSTTAGDRFEQLLSAALEGLAQSPEQAQEIEPGIRRWLLPPFPYALLYEIEGSSVLVLSVMHTRRRPGHWRGRGR
jgi:plasmid stabilization system protein ParE